MTSLENLSKQLAQCYYHACIAELQAIKPGNVHIFADGHRMSIDDFMQSATVSAPLISKNSSGVGERIFESVSATHNAVNCNTNLGIILVISPLIQALLHRFQSDNALQSTSVFKPTLAQLKIHLIQVLESLDVNDAKYVAGAIRLAKPAGLGSVATYDVNAPITDSLYTLMQAADSRDHIAYQYTHHFETIIDVALPIYEAALKRYQNEAWAVTSLYLNILSQVPDSHVARKYGQTFARALMLEAKPFYNDFAHASNPKTQLAMLLTWDTALKERQINPGTTADLTVATIFLASILDVT